MSRLVNLEASESGTPLWIRVDKIVAVTTEGSGYDNVRIVAHTDDGRRITPNAYGFPSEVGKRLTAILAEMRRP